MIFIDQGEEGGWQDVFFFAGGGFLPEGGFSQRGIFVGGFFLFFYEGGFWPKGRFCRRGFWPEGGFGLRGILSGWGFCPEEGFVLFLGKSDEITENKRRSSVYYTRLISNNLITFNHYNVKNVLLSVHITIDTLVFEFSP